jgi:ATP-dependent Clp protease protease subunit
MIHQGSGGFRGNTPDVMIQVKEMETLVNTNHEILSRHCGQPIEKIVADTSRDYFMSPTEAKEYGIIDAVYSATMSPLTALTALSGPASGTDGADDNAGANQSPPAELNRG